MLYFILCIGVGLYWARSWRTAILAPLWLMVVFTAFGLTLIYGLNSFGAVPFQIVPFGKGLSETLALLFIEVLLGLLLSVGLFALKRLIRGPVERWRS